jgi:hypothetical protein
MVSLSFVSIVARNNFIIVMSDGLESCEAPDGTMIRKREDIKKYIKIGSKQFLAFTGVKNIFDLISSEIVYKENGYHLLELAESYQEKINSIPSSTAKIMISIGGVNENQEIQLITLSNRPNKIDWSNKIPASEEISSSLMESSYINKENHEKIQSKLYELLKKYGYNTPNKVEKAQRDLNMFVERIDPSVNRKISSWSIKQ